MKQTNSTNKTGDGVNLFVCEWLPDGPPKTNILLIHGLGEHSGRYKHVAEFLTKAGIGVFSFDLRGHGKTEGVRGHAESYNHIMDDIDTLLTQIQKRFPSTSLFLYGHSLGGNLVLYHLIHRKPKIKGAIVTSPGLRTAKKVPAWKTSLGKILYALAPSVQMDNGLDVSGLSRNQAVIDAYKADPLVHPMVSTRLGMDIISNGLVILEKGGQIALPLMLMVGTADRIIDPLAVRELSEKISGVTFREWTGGYHELHNDEPEKMEVLQTMVDWIEDQIQK
ncbi:MAG: lysophospholipase [Anaerolineaceae bacterium]